MNSSKTELVIGFEPAYRDELIARARARQHSNETRGGSFVKTARILAIKIAAPFTVQTEHGVMEGRAGDWLATNHPDDDRSSDIWPISAERFAASYSREADVSAVQAEIERSLDEVAGEPVPLQEYSPDASPRAARDVSRETPDADLLQRIADHLDGFHTGECHCRRELEAVLPEEHDIGGEG